MGPPGAAETVLRFQHDERLAGALLGQMIRAADPGDACPNDQNVEVFGCLRGPGECRCLAHGWVEPFRVARFKAVSPL